MQPVMIFMCMGTKKTEGSVRLTFPDGPNKFFFGETLTNNGFGIDIGDVTDGRGKTKCGIG